MKNRLSAETGAFSNLVATIWRFDIAVYKSKAMGAVFEYWTCLGPSGHQRVGTPRPGGVVPRIFL